MSNCRYRRMFGLVLGSATGLAYALVSQIINSMFMPGIPLFQPPFGSFGNVVLGLVLGAVLGLASAWPETGFGGVVWSSLLGSLTIIFATLITGRMDAEIWTSKITALTILFVPTAAVLSPLLIIFRWITSREEMAYIEYQRLQARVTWQRVVFPVALVLVASAWGSLSLYNDLGRAVTPRMYALIQGGLKAETIAQLPKPLQDPEVDLFKTKANASFTLEWDKDDTNRFAIPRPATSEFDQSTVIARFSNGYWLVCMFPAPDAEPRCKDF